MWKLMLKLIQDNRELTILIAIGLLFLLLGFVGNGFLFTNDNYGF